MSKQEETNLEDIDLELEDSDDESDSSEGKAIEEVEESEESPESKDEDDSEDLIEHLEEREILKSKTDGGHVFVIGLALGVVLFCLFVSYKLVSDESLQVFACPTSRELDAPVAMKRLRDFGSRDVEAYIRGFVRRYVRSMYPKNSQEASYMYKWVANHSLGNLKIKYRGYDNDHEKIGDDLDNGKSTDFFPARATADKDGFRISKKDGYDTKWVVEIEGFLNDRKSMVNDDRGVVTLRLHIELGEVLLHGSQSGLYVSEVEITNMYDPVSNGIKKID